MATMQIRQSDDFITARLPNPKTGRLSPSDVSILTHHTPDSLEEALALSASVRKNAPQGPREMPWNARSKDWWMEIRSSPSSAPQAPRSRKKSFATIITDATADHPAFESDAFAVQMPTTREPIMEPTCSFRAKLPSPSAAQVAAYERYAEKARRNASLEYKKEHVPTKVVSYDYAYQNAYENPGYPELDASPPSSPPSVSAGAFPVSPPIPQTGFTPRSVSAPYQRLVARKPVAQVSIDTTASARIAEDSEAFPSLYTTSPPKPQPTVLKARLKPKAASIAEADRPQKESWWGLYTRPQTTTPTPPSTKPVFSTSTNTSTGSAESSDAGTKSAPVSPSKKEPKNPTQHKTLSSRLAWLRPTGPRVHKPSPSQSSTTPSAAATAVAAATYIDPFNLLSKPPTPASTRSPSPRKVLVRPKTPPRTQSRTFEQGFARVKSVAVWIVKLCLLIYVLVGLYYLLDAVREAVLVLSAPVRAGKVVCRFLWVGVAWLGRHLGRAWEK